MESKVANLNVDFVKYREYYSKNASFSNHPEVQQYMMFSNSPENYSNHEYQELSVENFSESDRGELDFDDSNCFSVNISMMLPETPAFQFSLNGIGISVIAFLGILGNVLSAVVLSRPQMKSSITCLLLGLGFCDTLLISISVLIFSMPNLHGHIESNFLWKYVNIYFGLWVPYLYPVSTTAQTGSVYLTLAVTIERYVAVCHSLRARSICTWGRAKICVAAVFLLSVVYNLPRWWEIIAIPVCEKVDNLTLYVTDKSVLRYDPTYVTVYINWTYLVVMYLIPFSGLVVLNTAIYRQVRRANRERQQLSKHQRSEMGLATMLLVVVVVFLLCNVLPLVNNILESFYETSFDQLVAISNFLVVVNSSVNFVIYCTCGDRFRRMFIGLVKNLMECRFGHESNTRQGKLCRKPTFIRRTNLEEMRVSSISSRTANHYLAVDLSANCNLKNVNISSTNRSRPVSNSMSHINHVQNNISQGRGSRVGRGMELASMSGRMDDVMPGGIYLQNIF